MNTIIYKDKIYPSFQMEGNAAQFAFPYALFFVKVLDMILDSAKKNGNFQEQLELILH